MHFIATLDGNSEERTGHAYIRTDYFCLDCNCFETLKVPQKLAVTINSDLVARIVEDSTTIST